MEPVKKTRSIYPIPKDWEKDEDRKRFAIRLDEIIRELFARVRNNLTTKDAGFVLDARQGKALADKWFKAIESNTNLNDLTTPGLYGCSNSTVAGTLVNSPVSGSGFSLLVTNKSNAYQMQILFYRGTIYSREKTSNGWGSWYKFTGTVV